MGESFTANMQFNGKACRSNATYMYDKNLGGKHDRSFENRLRFKGGT